jgi:anti-sigma B factor antagonist
MRIIEKDSHGRRTLEVRGDLDYLAAVGLGRRVLALLDAGVRALDIDLSSVELLGCRGIGVLLRARRLACARSVSLRVVNPSSTASWVIETAGARHILQGDERRAA